MFIIAGLGNPGPEYERTRHNVGFLVMDALASRCSSTGFVSWKKDKTAYTCKVRIDGNDCLLVKPMQFMNLSGEALLPILKFYKTPLENLIVVHDELDLAPGSLRIKKGGGAAGNQGIKNICQHLGAGFYRMRVGIGHPNDKIDEKDGKPVLRGGKNQSVSSWVLGEAGPNDQELLEKAIPFTVAAVEALVSKGLTVAQREFNGEVK